MKKLIKQITVDTEKARELERKGYILEHIMMHVDGNDTYNLYEKVGE